MAKGTRRVSARPHEDDEFPRRFRIWVNQNDGLVAGLVRLRELPRAERAVQAVLAVPELRRFRFSFELWQTLVIGDGDEPDRLLLQCVPLAMLDSVRLAIWGDATEGRPTHLRVVGDSSAELFGHRRD